MLRPAVGIRREDKNEWERRAPLKPEHVALLMRRGDLRVVVQPSPIRIFPESEYADAGAEIREDLAGCRLILGVKEVPLPRLLPETAYAYFSHTTKGQTYNMPTLERLLELRCTLVDYERVMDDRGRRLIFFGRQAGQAGMIDGLWALGRRLEAEGWKTPLLRIRRGIEYLELGKALEEIESAGERLRRDGLPGNLAPLVFGFLGSGNVTRGAVEVLRRLRPDDVRPEDLPDLLAAKGTRGPVVLVRFARHQRYRRIRPGPFDAREFAEHPERYRSALPRWLPFLTVLVNGAYWEPRQPRLVTAGALRELWRAPGRPRLRLIADISCDIGGPIEATVKATTPGAPVFVYEPDGGAVRDGVEGNGPVVLAVDNLPCELPREASKWFGDALLPYVPALAACPWEGPADRLPLPPELRRAVVVLRGRLAPDYRYLHEFLVHD